MISANYTFAREMARKVLKQYKIVEVPTDLRRICEDEGLEYMELDDPEAVDGMLMELEDGTRVAMVNRAKAYVRGRFTLAHELGHIFLRHDKRDFYDAEAVREYGEDMPESAKPPWEQEADAFAAELLIPQEQLKKYQAELKTSRNDKVLIRHAPQPPPHLPLHQNLLPHPQGVTDRLRLHHPDRHPLR